MSKLKANEREKYQIFIAKVAEVIGLEKTMQLLKESETKK